MPKYSARRGSYRRRYSSRRGRSSRLYSRYPRLTRGVRYVNSRDTSVSNVKVVCGANFMLQICKTQRLSEVAYIPAFISNEQTIDNRVVSGGLLSSSLYRLYSTLYDEVKVRGVQYQLTFTKPSSMASGITTCDVLTLMDRRYGNGEEVRSQVNMVTASTSAPITFTDYRVPIVRRYYAARDIIERVQYHDCTLKTRNNYDFDHAYEVAGPNPNFFSPCFQFCLLLPVAFEQDLLVPVNIRVTYYVTFRNPKGLNDVFDPFPEATREVAAEVPGEVPAEVPDEVPPEVTYADSVVT
ncbi:capsid protein [Duck ssDNA virus]|nr:capsid protein [Duck ssDNA virus]